jgi:hypothetical protein|nr:MAG TPA: hypothetical protein [Caudoviricetes sp.]
MLILNQKKNIVINFLNVSSVYVQDKNVQVLITFMEDSLILGKYNTEERAKEVLNEIIELYKNQINKYHFTYVNNVYEMPKE